MTRGIAPVERSSDQEAVNAQAREDKPRTIYIPDRLFAEFAEVTIENEEFFKYVANYVIMQFLEKVEDMKWVIQFPNNVPSQGRSHIHEVATYYGLTSHSIGSKKRSALVYPRTIFKDKQESEDSKKRKEFEKLREKNKGSMIGLENPKTNRDKMICLIYEQKKPEKD